MQKKKSGSCDLRFISGHEKSRIDTKVFYENLVFRNENDDVFAKQSFEIVGKLAILLLMINSAFVILGYISVVFFFQDERPLMTYLSDWVFGNVFSVSHLAILVISLTVFFIIKRVQKKLIRTQVSKSEFNKIILIAKFVPDYKNAVERRLKEQGFISKMDLILLQTNRLYEELKEIGERGSKSQLT